MFLIDTLMLIIGVLLLLGIASSKFSARLGVPVLVMFLALGMLAGPEGILGIEFENYALAHGIVTMALGLILFDGGLRTPYRSLRSVWRPAGMLATVGVVITALVTGAVATMLLSVSPLQGVLLGSIVASTDAAAVFAVLRSGGIQIRRRLADTLEVESGSNDPMAIFLTIAAIQVLTEELSLGWELVGLFLNQMVVGSVVGLLIGKLAVLVIDHIQLNAPGLYPVLATSFGLLSFGLAAQLHGSGFLATYLTGILIGNNRVVFHQGILLFHNAAAWLGQILMFTVLGLLSYPSRLLEVTGPGTLVALVLVLFARPIAVLCSVTWFRYSLREQLFLSWGGLKGAVPITLATFPLLEGMSGAPLLFDIVFFVVLISALVQGWSLPWLTRRLHLESPRQNEPPVKLELNSLRQVKEVIVNYFIDYDNKAAGRLIRELALPEEVVVALIVREQQIVLPKGNLLIQRGDHVVVMLRPTMRPLVDRVFARSETLDQELPLALEFPLKGSTKASDLEHYYSVRLECDAADATLDEAIRQRLGDEVRLGASVQCAQINLYVRELTDRGTIETVGMVVFADVEQASAKPDPPAPDPLASKPPASEPL